MTTHGPRLCAALAIFLAATLAGCTSVSGLNGSSSYACKAPDGVTCDSVSGTYANALQNNFPSQRPRAASAASQEAPASMAAPARPTQPQQAAAPSISPMPLRSSARILRLWFKPWEDADRDLYDQGYVYVQIDNGQWLIDHVQRQIRDAYAPLRPPPRSAASVAEPRDGTAPPANRPRPASPPPTDNPFPGLVPPAARTDAID